MNKSVSNAIQPDLIETANTEKKILTAKEQKRVDALAKGLKSKLTETVKSLIEIGKDFQELRSILGHGTYMTYVAEHFDMSYRTANHFIHVAEKLGEHAETVSHLSQRALYLLASPSIQDEKRNELLKEIEEGNSLTFEQIKERLKNEKGNKKKSFKIRISSFSKGFEKYFKEISPALKEYSGSITFENKTKLHEVIKNLHELENLVQKLLELPEPEKTVKGKQGRPPKNKN